MAEKTKRVRFVVAFEVEVPSSFEEDDGFIDDFFGDAVLVSDGDYEDEHFVEDFECLGCELVGG